MQEPPLSPPGLPSGGAPERGRECAWLRVCVQCDERIIKLGEPRPEWTVLATKLCGLMAPGAFMCRESRQLQRWVGMHSIYMHMLHALTTTQRLGRGAGW